MSSGREVTSTAAPATSAPQTAGSLSVTANAGATAGAANAAPPNTNTPPPATGTTAGSPGDTSTAGTTVENTPFKIMDGLNALALDTYHGRIDTKLATVEGQLRNLIIAANKRNIFEGTNKFYGQVLRVIDDISKTENYYLKKIFKDNIGLDVKAYKVIIPEIHRLFPLPKSFDQYDEDKTIIGLYPDFAYIPSSDSNSAEITVGDIVNCEFGNLAEYKDGKIISKATNIIMPSTAGAGGVGSAADGWSGRVECADKPPGAAPFKPEITVGQLRKAWPNTKAVYPNEILAVLNKYLAPMGYNSLKRVAAIMGQFEMETGGGLYIQEIGPDTKGKYIDSKPPLAPGWVPPTPKEVAHLNYFGRGLVGLTWWVNYKKTDEALGLGGKLYKDPGLMVRDHDVNVRASLKFMPLFHGEGSFKLMDNWDLLALSKKVNGIRKDGLPNGWPNRRDYANKWISLLDKDCKVIESPPPSTANAPKVEKRDEKTALLLGDSHSTQAYGDDLEKLLTTAGYKVTRIAQGSAFAPSFWDSKPVGKVENKLTSAWASAKGGPILVTKTQQTNTSGTSSGPPASGPKIKCDPSVQSCVDAPPPGASKTTESRIPYKILVVSMGTNDAGNVTDDASAVTTLNNFKRLFTETNAEIKFWSGPPSFSDNAAKTYNKAFATLDLNKRCQFLYANSGKVLNGIAHQLDTRQATKSFVDQNDIHFGRAGGKAWAEYVFSEIKKKIPSS